MNKLYRFPCGCCWPLLEENAPEGVIPLLDMDTSIAPEDCPATWALLGRGETKGIFQLESAGRQWTKKLKPENAEHITALGSLLRPGSLKAVDEEGISMTQHYCRRKNKEEELKPYHPAIDAILFPTYGVIAYQEQSMAICVAVANFNAQEADVVRKAIGKKLPEEMAKVKKMFIEGAAKAGIISAEQAEEVFGWIEKSQRYSFNKSHAACYGMTGYQTAYIKAHHPLAFFTAWLKNSKHKQDPQQEVYELINDAKLFDIEVQPPDLRTLKPMFHTDRKVIKFGLSDIKGIGEAQIIKIKQTLNKCYEENQISLQDMSWYYFLINVADKITSSVILRLIQVGALRWMNSSRIEMETDFKTWEDLTAKEKEWCVLNQKNYTTLSSLLKDLARPKKEGGGASNKNRVSIIQSLVDLLDNPPTVRVDTPHQIAFNEEQLLGISISCAKIDSCDTSQVNTSCKDFLSGKTGFMMFGLEVQDTHEFKTKSGKKPGSKYGRLILSDATCSVEAVAWPEQWREYSGLLNNKGNMLIVQGDRDFRDKESNTLIIKKVWQASYSK